MTGTISEVKSNRRIHRCLRRTFSVVFFQTEKKLDPPPPPCVPLNGVHLNFSALPIATSNQKHKQKAVKLNYKPNTSPCRFGTKITALLLAPSQHAVAFSSLARILGKCSTIRSPSLNFFFKVVISSSAVISFFMPRSVHSGSGG